MGISAVIFDIGGVLLTLGEEEYRQEVAFRLGIERLSAFYEAQVPSLQRGQISEEGVFAACAGAPVDLTKFDDIWLRHFRPVMPMLAFAMEIRALGLLTAVLSNTQASHVRIMRGMNFLEEFDPIFMSCEIGRRKPEATAFQYVLERLGLPPAAVAYIDDVPEYVEAARHLGLRAVLHTGDIEETRRAILSMVDEPRWALVEERLVLDGYWKAFEAQFRLPNGSEIVRRITRNRHPAMVLCLNENGKVLLTRQYRPPFNDVMWDLPGGDMETGESIEEAAARECEEETGYRPLHVEHVLTSRASPGSSDAEFHVCISHGVTKGSSTPTADEQMQTYWLDFDVALELARQKYIRHPGALLALLYVAAKRT